MDLEQFAKDLQAIMQEAAGDVPVYYGDAPRDNSEGLAVSPPFVVYRADMRAPADESGEFPADLTVDVWALGCFADAYRVGLRIDYAIEREAVLKDSGAFCFDRSGALFQRAEQDPDDERIRRATSQYLIRYNPKDL